MALVVVAPDSFKGSAPAADAAAALADGWRRVRPTDQLVLLPQADGGEGTAAAIASARTGGSWHHAQVCGPDGRTVTARWYRLDATTAVADMAEAAGLGLMRRLDAAAATSRGVGELIAAVAADGVGELWLGLGGSACTDGGAGALAALGYRLLDTSGAVIADGGAALPRLDRIERPVDRPPLRVRLITDVTAPLCGPTGAAAVFGPQKGADAGLVERLDAGLVRWAELLGGDAKAPGTGAAGGLGFGLATALDADLVDGAGWVADHTGLPAAVGRAEVLLTGEGRFDATSLLGKVVGHTITLAAGSPVAVQVVAGQVAADAAEAAGLSRAPIALERLAGSAEDAMTDPLRWLRTAGTLAAERHSGAAGQPPVS